MNVNACARQGPSSSSGRCLSKKINEMKTPRPAGRDCLVMQCADGRAGTKRQTISYGPAFKFAPSACQGEVGHRSHIGVFPRTGGLPARRYDPRVCVLKSGTLRGRSDTSSHILPFARPLGQRRRCICRSPRRTDLQKEQGTLVLTENWSSFPFC